jgi:hypothetical protein
MNSLRILLLFLLTTFLLEATIHEDAEDKKTSRWKLIKADDFTSLNNIDDLSKKSRVIEFQGDGTKHTYELQTFELKNKKTKKNEYWLSWQMKFSEDFVIIALVESNVGKHYLVYTPGGFKGHMQYGLGYATTNGEWKTFRRNLQEDIAYFDNRVKTVSLKSFVLKGNGRVDNIMTTNIMFTQKNKLHKKKLVKKYKQKKVFKVFTNSSPIITVNGVKLVQLSLGETYVEEGVSAYDKEDGDINVVSMKNIDFNEVGRYMVLYMATDSDGNIALDKRYVHVGEVQIEKEKIVLDKAETEELEENEKAEKSDYAVKEEQIKIWEKELKMREKELSKKEKKSNKN